MHLEFPFRVGSFEGGLEATNELLSPTEAPISRYVSNRNRSVLGVHGLGFRVEG